MKPKFTTIFVWRPKLHYRWLRSLGIHSNHPNPLNRDWYRCQLYTVRYTLILVCYFFFSCLPKCKMCGSSTTLRMKTWMISRQWRKIVSIIFFALIIHDPLNCKELFIFVSPSWEFLSLPENTETNPRKAWWRWRIFIWCDASTQILILIVCRWRENQQHLQFKYSCEVAMHIIKEFHTIMQYIRSA